MRIACVFLCIFSASSLSGQRTDLQKQIDSATFKIKAKDSATKIEGLKAAGKLRGDGIPLIPLVFAEMAGTGKKLDEKVVYQALIALESIDPEVHARVMDLRPAHEWRTKSASLLLISKLEPKRIALFHPAIDWMIPQVNTVRFGGKLKDKQANSGRASTGESGQKIYQFPTDDEIAYWSMLELFTKCGEKYREQYNAMIVKCLRASDAFLRERCYQEMERGSMRDDLKRQDKADLCSVFVAGLADPEEDIVYLCVKCLGNLGDTSKASVPALQRIAATHRSPNMRQAARESIDRIEK